MTIDHVIGFAIGLATLPVLALIYAVADTVTANRARVRELSRENQALTWRIERMESEGRDGE